MVGFPISHPNAWSFLVGKPMGLLGKPTIFLLNLRLLGHCCAPRPKVQSARSKVALVLVGWETKGQHFWEGKLSSKGFDFQVTFQGCIPVSQDLRILSIPTGAALRSSSVWMYNVLSWFPCYWGKNHLSKSFRKKSTANSCAVLV